MASDADDSDEFEVPPEKVGPRPKVTILTMILIFLNMVAALGFVFLMSLNFQKRQAWAFATFQRDLEIQGLPLKEEDHGQSASRAALPRMTFSGETLRAAFSKRGGPLARVPEAFKDIDEPMAHTIEPRYLTADILKAYFGDALGPTVPTLEDEIARLKTEFPRMVADAAKARVEIVKKIADPDKRRDEVRRLVLPAAYSTKQIRDINTLITTASADKLLEILDEGLQRRLILEALTPVETFRPGTLDKKDDKFLIIRAGDLEAYPLAELKRQFEKRMDAAVADKFDGEMFFGEPFAGKPRGSIEKRMTIGLTLLSIAHVHEPVDDGKPPKYLAPEGVERAKKVLGLWEFAHSALNYTFCLGMLYGETYFERDKAGKDRIVSVGLLTNIKADREGFMIIEDPKTKEKKVLPGASFWDRHDAIVGEIIDLQRDLHATKGRLDAAAAQNKLAEKTYSARVTHLADTVDRLSKSRARTLELVAKARELQEQLFEAQVRLVDAAEANFRLEEDIRREQLPKKGKRP